MTAEITIMNASAIAMAADSAVTIGNGKEQKIYNSVNKLFTLSKCHPVGVMIYGSAELMTVPWETIIKIYRKNLGRRKFSYIKEYADDFLKFIEKNNVLFPKKLQEGFCFNAIGGYFNELIKQEIDDKIKKINPAPRLASQIENEIKQIIIDAIKKRYDELIAKKYLQGMSRSYEILIRKKYAKFVNKVIGDVFQKLPISKAANRQLHEIAVCIITRDIFSDALSGLVIAGFGEKEHFPTMVSYEINLILNNKLKYRPFKSFTISNSNNSCITPFAQGEMVATFMEGVDPSLNFYYDSYLTALFDKYPDIIVDNVSKLNAQEKSDLRKKLKDMGLNMFKDYEKQIIAYKRKFHVDPILNAVGALPKDELAAMAESLVHLTSLKRKISLSAETVGGPIDVAVISKGDGFVWIKRKHYFKAELNQHFMVDYYNR